MVWDYEVVLTGVSNAMQAIIFGHNGADGWVDFAMLKSESTATKPPILGRIVSSIARTGGSDMPVTA